MIERVPGLGSDPVHISLSFKSEKIFLRNRKVIDKKTTRFTAAFRMVFMKERNWDIESGSVVLVWRACLGQNRFSGIEAQVLCVVGEGARVEVEDDMVESSIPVLQLRYFATKKQSVECFWLLINLI